MLLDANDAAQVASELSTDVAIVGAGTVGVYLASRLRLLRPTCRVTVIEAGSPVATTAENAATSTSVGRPHGGTLLGRASGLGGTSTLWGGQLAEFRRTDLERDDGTSWPLDFDTLETYYRQVYRDLGIGAPQDHATYRQTFGGENESHDSIDRVFTYWLKQPNFAVVFKDLIQHDAGLNTIVNATVNGIDFEGPCARRLRCHASSGRTITVDANSIIFAGGTLATIRFFLSAQLRQQVPWRENRQIGLYFQDHLGGKIADVTVLDDTRFRNFFENGWVSSIKLQPKLTFTESHRRKMPIAVCGMFGFDSELSQNLENLKGLVRNARSSLSYSTMRSGLRDATAVGRTLLPIVWRFARQRRILAVFDRGVTFNVQAEQIPIAASQVRLALGEPTADGLRPIVVDWRCDGRELEAIRAFAERSDSYLQSHGVARLSIDSALQALVPNFLDGLADTFHQCGGLRMSNSPESGVVDSDCRVWGTSNVWIASAAVFPSSSFANCTLTALALAARLVDRLTA